MSYLGQMVLFARVVEAGSFAAAAAAAGQTRAAVSKQIAGLEAHIGAQLLNRTTRRMSLTEVGQEFYARCARIAREAEEAERAVASLQGAPRGSLRVSAPVTFGRRYLSPRIAAFLERYPEIAIELRLSDADSDLVEDGFDVGIRIAPRAGQALTGRRLAPSPRAIVAAPDYLARRGTPRTPEDLRRHDCLLYSQLATPALWRFRGGRSVRVKGRFRVDHGDSLRQAVLDGLGVAYMPTFIVGPDIAEHRLVALLSQHAESRSGVWVVHPRNRNLTPKVRAFVEFLVEQFRDGAPWELG